LKKIFIVFIICNIRECRY